MKIPFCQRNFFAPPPLTVYPESDIFLETQAFNLVLRD